MVFYSFSKSGKGEYTLKINGHAGFNTGNDIVCAGISSLAFTLTGTLKTFLANGIQFKLEHHDNDGDYLCRAYDISMRDIPKLELAYNIIYIGLKQIELTHPLNIRELNIESEDKDNGYSKIVADTRRREVNPGCCR